MRTSATPRSSSVADTLGNDSLCLDDSRYRDDVVAPHDERPRLALRAGHLRVDEHVLDLPAPTCQAVSWPPSAHSKSWQLRADQPLPPAHLAGELDRAVREHERLWLEHGPVELA